MCACVRLYVCARVYACCFACFFVCVRTRDGTRCDAEGNLEPSEFEAMMREELEHYIENKASTPTYPFKSLNRFL